MTSNFNDRNSLFNFVIRDGNGIKGLVDSGIKEVPTACIQPPERRINKLTARRLEQPPINLSLLDGPDHEKVVQEIITAAETLGIFQVVNHGVSVELLESLREVTHRFFGQPPEKKGVYRKDVGSSPLVNYGTSFLPEKEDVLAWKDCLSLMYTSEAEALEQWPEECRILVLEYVKQSTKLVRKLLEILLGNFGVTPDDQRIDAYINRKLSFINFYPSCPNPNLTLGAISHSDLGTLTALIQDDVGGLYAEVEDDSLFGNKGEWLEIPPISNALIINVGDSLQMISNGRYKTVKHAVASSEKSRVSVLVFSTPTPEVKIGPLPEAVAMDGIACYQEMPFADYMKHFFGKTHSGERPIEFAKIKD